MFVSNSAKYSDIGHPFGYLKASTNLNCVNLFVMPYNYPALLPLLGEYRRCLFRLLCFNLLACQIEWNLLFAYALLFYLILNPCFSTDDLFRIHKLKPTLKWKQQFENYLKTMPVYYALVSLSMLEFNILNTDTKVDVQLLLFIIVCLHAFMLLL